MTSERLFEELSALRQENQQLQAQLNFHKKLFREVHEVIGVAGKYWDEGDPDEFLQKLVKENEQLKNQLKIQKLSPREQEILYHIAEGLTSREIAEKLQISKLTVDTHRKNIQQKLGVENVVDLIRMALGQ